MFNTITKICKKKERKNTSKQNYRNETSKKTLQRWNMTTKMQNGQRTIRLYNENSSQKDKRLMHGEQRSLPKPQR